MAEYTQIDEDLINKTESVNVTTNFDLLSLINQLKDIKKTIDTLPIKTNPDAETLAYWNKMFLTDRQHNIDEAKDILKQLKEIYDAGYLPTKYIAPLISFNQWLNNL